MKEYWEITKEEELANAMVNNDTTEMVDFFSAEAEEFLSLGVF